MDNFRTWLGYTESVTPHPTPPAKMSTRSYQRLAGDTEVLRIPSRSGERKVRRKPRNDSSADGEPHEGGPFSHEGLMARKQMAHSVNSLGMGMVRSLGVMPVITEVW